MVRSVCVWWSDMLSDVLSFKHSQQYLQEQMSSQEQQIQHVTEVQYVCVMLDYVCMIW